VINFILTLLAVCLILAGCNNYIPCTNITGSCCGHIIPDGEECAPGQNAYIRSEGYGNFEGTNTYCVLYGNCDKLVNDNSN
jgi:uncharacterized lipoprotein NlpE involved in copper resistance